jgi:exonuclease SbcC
MITSIELHDFLSHEKTIINFEDGVTIFVGDNGAGKSSIIDAITFSLFGKHTRKSNKGLIRRGNLKGAAIIKFSIKDKQYKAERKIDSKGNLKAALFEVTDNNIIQIAAGERKQFKESMTEQVEKIVGMSFEKLKIASIVQQGELNSIINAKPKEFKELLNAIIGIDKLDIASESMKKITKEFREENRTESGHDDTQIDILRKDSKKYRDELKETKPKKDELELQKDKLTKEITELVRKDEIEAPKREQKNQLKLQKKELVRYVKETIKGIRDEVEENERKILDCKNCFDELKLKADFEKKLEDVEKKDNDLDEKIKKIREQIASLKEQEKLAEKLQLKDNKCPVCDSSVKKLNSFFQEKQIKEDRSDLEKDVNSKEKERDEYSKEMRKFETKLKEIEKAEAKLEVHSIKTKEELEIIQKETKIKRRQIPLVNNENLEEISQIDNHAKLIFDNIIKLESETKGFNEEKFENLKKTILEKRNNQSLNDNQLGEVGNQIKTAEKQSSEIKESILELEKVKDYISRLDNIQKHVFNRDGSVATSLRSWALNSISIKASEYLSVLNTKIQRITLSEKTRDVSIACHSKTEVLELESLSGGEKVSVALALRLGMANLLGSSNLNLMILDEPTTHLDAERKKSLVEVLTQLSGIGKSQTAMQFLIITHDAEIFENEHVGQVHEFKSTEEGSKVTEL